MYGNGVMTPGRVLRGDYGINEDNADYYAHRIGTSKDKLIDLLNDDQQITPSMSVKLANALGIQDDTYFRWLQIQVNKNASRLRKSMKKTHEEYKANNARRWDEVLDILDTVEAYEEGERTPELKAKADNILNKVWSW